MPAAHLIIAIDVQLDLERDRLHASASAFFFVAIRADGRTCGKSEEITMYLLPSQGLVAPMS